FDAWVDWHQPHEFLECRSAFLRVVEHPLHVPSDTATYETQSGHLQRLTQNTRRAYVVLAVMPHKGRFLESDVPTAAYLFNSPLYSTCSTSMCSSVYIGR
ncbi:hypothetical protein FB45DRAFT_896397, partial [Roridomyces roridus]